MKQSTERVSGPCAASGVRLFLAVFALGLAAASSVASAETFQRILLGPGRHAYSELHVLGNSLIFYGAQGSIQPVLFATDGTQIGTRVVRSNFEIDSRGPPGAMVVLGDRAYFNAYTDGDEVWTTDGTPFGTFKLGGARTDRLRYSWYYTPFGGRIYFVAMDDAHGAELWSTAGTRESTHLAVDLVPGPASSQPYGLMVHDDALFFFAQDQAQHLHWYRSDGTPQGTIATGDVPATGASTPLIEVNGRLFFFSGGSFAEPWSTDGTTAGTYSLSAAGSADYQAGYCNGLVYFTGFESGIGSELMVTDGTVAGTRRVISPSGAQNFQCIDDVMYFWGLGDNGYEQVWRSDGTTAGTVQLTDVFQFINQYLNERFVEYHGRIYFTAAELSDTFGYELWVLDGSAEGAHRVSDLNPGDPDASPTFFTQFDDKLYFLAQGVGGWGLWRMTSDTPTDRRVR
jgi:ELWxxDGT repeat protein